MVATRRFDPDPPDRGESKKHVENVSRYELEFAKALAAVLKNWTVEDGTTGWMTIERALGAYHAMMGTAFKSLVQGVALAHHLDSENIDILKDWAHREASNAAQRGLSQANSLAIMFKAVDESNGVEEED